MSGGILQLVAYGSQDLYITGQPQITFFKTVYRRHTMFSMESIQQTFNGQANLGNRITSTISRNGDLLHKLWVVATVTAPNTLIYDNNGSQVIIQQGASFIKNVGYGLLKKIEVEIGGQVIDRQYSDWLQVWSELTTPEPKAVASAELSGLTVNGTSVNSLTSSIPMATTNPFPSSTDANKNVIDATTLSSEVTAYINTLERSSTKTLYIPLEFWFCRNVGLALPLIALQYHEVKINIELASLTDITYLDGDSFTDSVGVADGAVVADLTGATADITTTTITTASTEPMTTITTAPSGTPITGIELWADYIYLDVEERKRFAQVSHEYLIDQLQFVGASSVQASSTRHTNTLTFNHPVKELVWVFKSATNQSKSGVWIPESTLSFSSVSLKLNGHDRFASRPGKYFSMVQPFQHHTRVPTVGAGIYLYSFALKPEEHQPSGSCNFSRIDNAQLNFEGTFPGTASVCQVYATNYNILRIISGMGGQAFSN